MSRMPGYNLESVSMRPSRRIAAGLAKTTASSIYEVPQGRSGRVSSVSICNTGASRVTVRLHHVLPGESAALSNAIFYDLELAGYSTVIDYTARSMNSGERIFAQASTASVVAFMVYGDAL